jgi:hypothetical protein
MTHHLAHHFGAWLAVSIGSFTAIAISLWVAISNQKDPDA